MAEKRGKKTTWAQVDKIIDWIEVPGGRNYRLLFGEEAETLNNVVAGAKLKKIHAYELLADYVNQHCGTNWGREDAMNRWRALFKKYKAVKRAYSSDCGTKYGLSEIDLRRGLTIEKNWRRNATATAAWMRCLAVASELFHHFMKRVCFVLFSLQFDIIHVFYF